MDLGDPGSFSYYGRLKASGDRSQIVAVDVRDNGGRTFVYHAATDQFGVQRSLNSSLNDIAVNRTGSTAIAGSRGFVLDPASVAGVLAGGFGTGYAVHPTLGVGYRSVSDRVDVLNLSTFLKLGERALGDSVPGPSPATDRGRMDASDDGTLLAVITNNGFSIVKPFPFAPERVNLVGNGDFAAGLTGWQTSGSGQVVVSFINGFTNNALHVNRHTASPEPMAAQSTAQTVPAGAPLDARLGLGNSASGPRTIRVRLADADGGDPRECTFLIPAQTPLATYRMRAVTAEAWSNVTMSLDVDPASGDGGFARVDNVSVMFDSSLGGGDECVTPPPAPPVGTCQLSQPTPYAVPVTGTFTAVMIDDACRYVYMLNRDLHRVDVFSLHSLTFEESIQVGSMPTGLDITPDGLTMYVANGGGNNVSVVDLAQRIERGKITLIQTHPSGHWINRMGGTVAVGNNGRLLVTTMTWCCQSPDGLQEILLFTGTVTERTDVPAGSSPYVARASADRSIIGLLGGSIAGPVAIYRSATGTITPPAGGLVTTADFSINGDGSRLFVMPGNQVVDSTPAILGSFTLTGTTRGAALHPTLGLAYRPLGSSIDVLDVEARTQIGSLPLGGTTDTITPNQPHGQVDISNNGRLLAIRTTTGYSLVDPFAAGPPQNFSIVKNGSFAGGMTGWSTFALPDASYIDSRIENGVFEFNRLPAAPPALNQAVVFQHTGIPLPAGAPIQAQFDLGNSSSARKRISVLLLDSNFTDLHVCTFWLAPNSPLATYRMRSHSTQPWANAAIYFYSATPGADGGYNRIDNISLSFNTTLPDDQTACEDPTRPTPTGDPDGPDLVGNGGFSTPGTIAPWGTFGTITSQFATGVFEFVRPNATVPAGVVEQATGQPVGDRTILTATLALGNSSGVRKRVTVVLRDGTFSDLSACTFWLAPGQPLSPYSMRMFTTQAWANATISVYAATVGPEQWIRLDDVTVRATPSAAITGTDCVEPPSSTPPGPAAVAAASAATGATIPIKSVSRAQPEAPAPGREAVAPGALSWIDLSDATSARIRFESILQSGHGELQVSDDGLHWSSVLAIDSSPEWAAMEASLGPWVGRPVAIRFVLRGAERDTAPHGRLRHLRVISER
jgi:hypothetical protein